ncbi:DUF3862 domain-containing protein [Saccharibacillus sacchari]|uniref:DUF3862 domain-containing protein n=1 Tax=Saccharibacillus sacchari TaxID=456493 RepID=A0ACC6PI75_9BACL
MTALFGIFFLAFIVFFFMCCFNILRKNAKKLKRNGLIAIGCFVISMIAVSLSGSVTVTPKEEATAASKSAAETVATPAAEPATEPTAEEATTAEAPAKEEAAANEPTQEEWEASYREIVLNETESYITSSAKKALSKDGYESALGVIEMYSARVGTEQLDGYSRLAAAVKANDLDETKAIYKELGGEDFPELSQDAEPVDFTAAAEAPVASGEAATISKSEYDRVKDGMSYKEVANIIGGEGEALSESGSPGEEYYTIMVMYYGDDASTGANANFIFQGDKLINKAQFSLK